MVIRLFKNTGPGVIVMVAVALIAVWLSAFINPGTDIVYSGNSGYMPLYAILDQVIGNNHLAGTIISFLVVSMMAFLLVNFNTTVFFINERTYLPALIYILFGGLFPQYQVLNPVIPATVFLMLAIIRIMDGYRKPGIAYNFFDAAILISTGSLFYANLIWFGLLVIIGIALLRTGNPGEIAISILGLITPYLITFGMYYVLGKDIQSLISLIEDNLFGRSGGYSFPRLTILALVFTATGIIFSIIYLFLLMNTKKIKSRKTFSILIWVFLISTGIYLLPSVSVEIVWLTGIPVSYFLAHYFVFVKKKLVPEIYFSLFIILVFLIQIWYLK